MQQCKIYIAGVNWWHQKHIWHTEYKEQKESFWEYYVIQMSHQPHINTISCGKNAYYLLENSAYNIVNSVSQASSGLRSQCFIQSPF